jgi:hypothetical protein
MFIVNRATDRPKRRPVLREVCKFATCSAASGGRSQLRLGPGRAATPRELNEYRDEAGDETPAAARHGVPITRIVMPCH